MPQHRVLCTALLVCLLSGFGYALAVSPFDDFRPTADYPTQTDYLALLQEFPRYAEKLWHQGVYWDSDAGYYNTGGHDHNQMRSLANFIFVYSLLASRPEWDSMATGISQSLLLKRARSALRYFTATHVSGNQVCVDGYAWGKQPEQWVSPWVISKAVAGARLIWNQLTSEERNAIGRVVQYEANYQLKQRALNGDLRHLGGRYPALTAHAEFNSLNAELLSWAAALYPTHYNAKRWREKAQEFFMNAFSVEADKYDTRLVDGKPVNEWVYTRNLHPDFSLEAHGAYQFDYIACPLHSRAWAYYAFLSNGQPVPEALLHHVPDVWGAVKRTHLYSGRFAYLQGKDWARHIYGLYFIAPALVMIQQAFNDADARLVEQLRFRAFQWEQERNFNGGIFAQQFAYQTRGWPPIYESDAYANLGLAYLLHQFKPPIPPESMERFQQKVAGTVDGKYAEFLYSRSEHLFTSFSWRHLSRRYPMALFVPGDDYIAEWGEGNLIGRATVQNADMKRASVTHRDSVIEDGFTTTGTVREAMLGYRYSVDHHVSFTALPKEGMALLIERLVAKDRVRLTENLGLTYDLPNDLFNGNVRQIHSEAGDELLSSGRGEGKETNIHSRWINVDDTLGIVSLRDTGNFRIRAGSRNMWFGQICDEIGYAATPWKRVFQPGEVIREQAYLLVSGDRQATQDAAQGAVTWLSTDDPMVKAVYLETDRSSRLIVSNFGQSSTEATIKLADGHLITRRIPGLMTTVEGEPGGTEILHAKDNSAMVLVPAGEFLMGTSASHFAEVTRGDSYRQQIFQHELPQHSVYLDSFYIDKYEVTNARFAYFVEETGYVTDAGQQGWGYIWEGYNDWPKVQGANWRHPLGPGSSLQGRMNHPVIQVSYNDALAYAAWAGKRLPTEAQWEKAARGTDGRRYPWGNQSDMSRLNSSDRGPGDTTPVGSYARGASPYGMDDALGNVWEWVADWFDPHYYSSRTVWKNPVGPPTGKHRVLKGGAWLNQLTGMRVSFRDNHVSVPDFRVQLGGFRCTKPASPFEISGQIANPEDVNGDGVIDVLDLVAVGSQYGSSFPALPEADIDHDGVVGLADLVSVALRFGEEVSPAPADSAQAIALLSSEQMAATQRALTALAAKIALPPSAESLMRQLQHEPLEQVPPPAETRLLSNYPNPFNPETWFPYELAVAAEVSIHIYDIRGNRVQTLSLGRQEAGRYTDPEHAAYWNGRDQAGQPVVSGVYFYLLVAGDFTELRKMVVRR